ncbi:MAG: hypothetical protein JWP57_699 [Spirosoma sp.]|nr:hypothetical protein [Spirosoma sp.]
MAKKTKSNMPATLPILTDKIRLGQYVEQLAAVPRPEVRDPKAQEVSDALKGFLQVVTQDMYDEIKSL